MSLCNAFDPWGRGTLVTVSPGKPASSLSPLFWGWERNFQRLCGVLGSPQGGCPRGDLGLCPADSLGGQGPLPWKAEWAVRLSVGIGAGQGAQVFVHCLMGPVAM